MFGIILGIVGLAGGGGIVALVAKFGLNVVLGKAGSLMARVRAGAGPGQAAGRSRRHPEGCDRPPERRHRRVGGINPPAAGGSGPGRETRPEAR
jgi:hypothetical protein